MTFIQIDGMRFNVERLTPPDSAPAAGTVLLIHGLGSDNLSSWYFTIAPTLAAAGMDVVMYDQRGHGRSARPATGYQVERFVDDCEAVLGRLDLTGPVHVIGNSFGGSVAFGLAARRPDLVASIVAVEAEPATAEWIGRMVTVMGKMQLLVDEEEKAFAWLTENRGERQSKLLRVTGRFLSTTSLATDLLESQVLDAADLRAIDCPVLALYGSESPMLPQAPGLVAALPRCRSIVIPGQEHFLLMQASEEVGRLTLDWLTEQGLALRMVTAGALT